MRVVDVGNLRQTVSVEGGRREDQDARVDEEGEEQAHRRIDRCIPDRRAPLLRRVSDFSALHDGGVEVEVVGHDGRAEDADRDEEHLGVPQDLRLRHQRREDGIPLRLGHRERDRKTGADHGHKREDKGLEVAEASLLKHEHKYHVECRDADTRHHRNAEEQIERDGRPEQLGEVAGCNGKFAKHPEREADGA